MRSHIFSKEFVEVLEDLHALKCVRDVPGYVTNDAMGMAHVNNHTASIQSRLMGLGNLSPLLKCCQLAAYISSVMLCCTVWCALVIPVSEPRILRSISLAPIMRTRQDTRLLIYPDPRTR